MALIVNLLISTRQNSELLNVVGNAKIKPNVPTLHPCHAKGVTCRFCSDSKTRSVPIGRKKLEENQKSKIASRSTLSHNKAVTKEIKGLSKG